jgi:phosphohistidine swiveling domain-containing protein
VTPEQALIELGDDSTKREIVGGKAAALGLLVAAGYRVPPGLVVTAAAWNRLGDDLLAALTEAAASLGPGPFAVRSSAAAEDLPDASYAGLYETYLDVGRDGLGETVRRCFASAAAHRVSAYQAARTPALREPRQQDGPDSPAMAVLVQQMVAADVAGVAFTANPVTGQRDQIVVTAVRGLGEPLVSGEAVGEEWVVRGRQAICTRPAGDVLSAAQALEVAELAASVATRFGVPQDIEWAIDPRQQLFLLQARAMTALPDPVQWSAPGPGLWTRNFRLGEWLPEAMTPLFADWPLNLIEAGYLDGMRTTAGVSVPFRYATVNGWYYNATPIPSPRLFLRALRESRGRAPWFLYNALVRVSRDPAAADRAVLSDLHQQWREDLLPAYVQLVEAGLDEVDQATPHRLVEIVDRVCCTAGEYMWSLAIVGGSAWKMEQALGRFWRKHLAGPLAGTPVGQAGPQQLLRGLPGAGPSFASHAVFSLDWYHPTAAEIVAEPRTTPTPHAEEPGMDLAAKRTATVTACRVALHDRPKLLAQLEELLAVAQRYAVIREEQARDFTLGWPVLRRCALRLGEHLMGAGMIDAVDDIFFLTRSELTDVLTGTSADLTGTVTDRRAQWQRQRHLAAPLTLGHPPRLIGDPIARAVDEARSTHDLPAEAIVGHPASAGRATGRVRIINGPADFASFAQGEILVTKATAPAWTPLFSRAAAVVTDGGTLAAHASLVAREYGIPAVVGTGDATSRLRTGQLVTVDGSAGTVQPCDAH